MSTPTNSPPKPGSEKMSQVSNLYSESNLMDSEIRKTLQKKDYTISTETKALYDKEETQLREFFSELKAPVKEDPTLVRTIKFFEKNRFSAIFANR